MHALTGARNRNPSNEAAAKPTPQTARPPESAKDIINQVICQVFHYDVRTAAMLLPLILQNLKYDTFSRHDFHSVITILHTV